MRHLFVLIAVCFSTVFASEVDDLIAVQQSIMSKISSHPTLSKTAADVQKVPLSDKPEGLPKVMTSVGSAVITYPPYNFEWMIFSGGWYWKSTDEYASFYSITQIYNDPSVFGAFLDLSIHRLAGTPYDHAVAGITVAVSNDATIYENKTLATLNGVSCYYNSYSYKRLSITYSVDEWHFTVGGTSYTYRIFTTVSDWNENKTYYSLLKIGLILHRAVTAKSLPAAAVKPHISYYPNLNGTVTFLGLPSSAYLYIYDMQGNLLRNLEGNTWDGLTNSGNKVTKGFYVTNIKMTDGVSNLKIFKK